jgi:hypothetical protein
LGEDAPADLWRSTNVRDVTSTGFETFVIPPLEKRVRPGALRGAES